MKYEIKKPWIHIRIDAMFHNQSVLSFLEYYKQSKKNRYLLIQEKRILLNQKPTAITTMLKQGDQLSLKIFIDMKSSLPADYAPIDIIYEDEFLLIVNKPPHLLIHSDGSNKPNLCNRVQGYFHITDQPIQPHPIHRLDKDTSGLVIFSKCPFFQPYFDDLLKQKQISREYKAIAEGILPLHKDILIKQPIGRDRHDAKKQRISKTGKEAYTIIRCERHIHGNSLVHCSLKTGRTHQIRVHMAYLNHPLLSDELYGHPSKLIDRLALHAYRVIFIHPLSQKKMQVTTALPDDFPI